MSNLVNAIDEFENELMPILQNLDVKEFKLEMWKGLAQALINNPNNYRASEVFEKLESELSSHLQEWSKLPRAAALQDALVEFRSEVRSMLA